MTPQLEALAMLNNMFESYDGRPVKNAVLSREDYALLAQALTARTSYAAPEGEATWVTVPDDQFSFDWVKPGMRVKLESGRVLLVGNVNDLMGECDCCRVHGRIVAYQSTPQERTP